MWPGATSTTIFREADFLALTPTLTASSRGLVSVGDSR